MSGSSSATGLHPQQAIHAQSLANREDFWLKAAAGIHWHRSPTKAWGPSARLNGAETWFPGAELNTCFNCLDRNVYPPESPFSPPLTPSPHTPHLSYDPSLANRVAFEHVSPLQWQTVPARSITYGQALEYVQTLSGVLKARGIRKGHTVVIYMPMIPETALAMLACARIGAVFSVVFGGFAAKELGKRIKDSGCKLVLTASCGLEPKGVVAYKPLVDEALRECGHTPTSGVLFLRRHTIRDHTPPTVDSSRNEFDWEEEMDLTRRGVDGRSKCWSCHPVGSEDALYSLYTSGTTGTPKGVVRFNGGHAVQLRYSIEHTFGMTRDDTMFCASDLGWVVGHAYILFAPLLIGAKTILFEGKPVLPDAGIFWQTISRYGVTHFFTAPTALRAVRGADPEGRLMTAPGINLRTLRTLFLAGERSEPQIVQVYSDLLRRLGAPGASVNDNYWSTELGSPVTALSISPAFAPLPARPGSAGLPQAGMDVRVVDDEGREVSEGVMGNLVLARPLAPSALGGLWNNEEGFQRAYWDRFRGKGDWYDTGDSAFVEQGYVTICARSDDLINVAAHRLATGLIEQAVTAHPSVVECCVVGAPDAQKGQAPFAVVVSSAKGDNGDAQAAEMLKSINEHVRAEVGPIAQLAGLVITAKLPKTRSGKTLRRSIRAIVENVANNVKDGEVPVPPTIEDRDVLGPITSAIERHFAAKGRNAAKL
ncbi:unnamed protein product [Parajaminaea phylloscopi]